jgi:hypothetical protein
MYYHWKSDFFHPIYKILKPSGIVGHRFGITGTLLMAIGIFSNMTHKRSEFFGRVGVLKY